MWKIIDDNEVITEHEARKKYGEYRFYFLCKKSGEGSYDSYGKVYGIADNDDDWHAMVKVLNEKEKQIIEREGGLDSIGFLVGYGYVSPEYNGNPFSRFVIRN